MQRLCLADKDIDRRRSERFKRITNNMCIFVFVFVEQDFDFVLKKIWSEPHKLNPCWRTTWMSTRLHPTEIGFELIHGALCTGIRSIANRDGPWAQIVLKPHGPDARWSTARSSPFFLSPSKPQPVLHLCNGVQLALTVIHGKDPLRWWGLGKAVTFSRNVKKVKNSEP